MTPLEHFLDWLTADRILLLNGGAFDKLAGRQVGTFSRFWNGKKGRSLKRLGLIDYYPILYLVGYLPPSDVWRPQEQLSEDESSSDLRTWFTERRRALISRRAVDVLSKRPFGVLNRYLNSEPHVVFKIAPIQAYYPTLQLLGFVPPK